MEFIKPGTRIPFTKYRRVAAILSTLVNIAVLALLFTKGPNLGVDFAGGTMVHLKFQQRVSIPEIRQALGKSALGDTVIQDFGQDGSNEFMVRLEKTSVQIGALGEDIRRGLANQFGQDSFEVRRVESVGPKVGKDLRERGIWSVIAATLMMGVYIWVRFGFSFGARFGLHFGLGAVIALIHDVLVTVGALLVAQYEFDLTIVAALLTIVGFSVNDTVVICDRIRENMRKSRREGLESIINTSINETISRTILTTGTALMVLIALFFLGGGVIRPFAFALLVGFSSGVYSTIFIASPVILLWERGKK
ncbi:MAG TPA: protein translocase subunit SecF [Deltaproteobacteria bacterium]|nr:MAG: protein-export membrane protein SecF [Deltaproteobacteria bacterium GWD2_55_8]HBA39243.1 protein translocase subunit SecF [Deltaproteobacteria bacterium]